MDNIYYIGNGPGGNLSPGDHPGGLPPAGGSGPPGGPGNDGSAAAAAATGGISHSDTNQSLNSNVSYTTEDLREFGGAELQNVKNILQDKSLTPKEKENKVLTSFARLTNELIEAKREISRLKQRGNIPIMFDTENK